MAQVHEVSLLVGPEAERIDVCDEYQIDLSMLRSGNGCTFAFWRSTTAHSTYQRLVRVVKLGHRILLRIDGQAVFDGRVESIDEDDTNPKDGDKLVVSARDKAGRAVSWDADPTISLRGRTLDDALNAVFLAVGMIVELTEHVDPVRTVGAVRVSNRAPSRAPVRATTRRTSLHQLLDLVHPQIGEQIWSLAQRIVRKSGYLMWVAPGDGTRTRIVVDVPRAQGTVQWQFKRERLAGEITDDSNILSRRHSCQIRDVPTSVTVFGDAMRGDSASARVARTVRNTKLDDQAITFGRVADALELGEQPRYIRDEHARSVTSARQRAERAIADAMAGFRMYTCSVQGHGQWGVIYQPNLIGHVRDDDCLRPDGRHLDEDMLCTEVSFMGSRAAGQTSRVTLVPLGAIHVEPES